MTKDTAQTPAETNAAPEAPALTDWDVTAHDENGQPLEGYPKTVSAPGPLEAAEATGHDLKASGTMYLGMTEDEFVEFSAYYTTKPPVTVRLRPAPGAAPEAPAPTS